tara:strand:- start:1538 stop:2842 length:1305 start_codon:yes stop_codon:yes gene_type:complete
MTPETLSFLGDLLLDPKNPRHPEISSQPDLIKHFSRDDRTYALAGDILANGLNPLERLMVYKDGKDYYVLEGNRRTAAVKLLHNPNLAASNALITKFKNLKKHSKAKVPKDVECIVSPDRLSANLWLSRKHSGTLGGIGVVPWGALQRERFDVANGKTGQYPFAMAVLDWLKVTLSDDFPISVLSRFVQNPKIRSGLGISIKDGDFVIEKEEKEVRRVLDVIVKQIDDKKIGTATIETSDDQIKILQSTIEELGAKISGIDDVKLDLDQNKGGQKKGEKNSSGGSKTKYKKPRTTIAPRNFKPVPTHAKTLRVLNELKSVNVNNYPIAAAGAFRTFIEISGIVYRQKKIGKKADKNTKLDAILGDINKYMNDNSLLSAGELKRLNQFKSSINNPMSKDALNASLHNPSYSVDAESLRVAWDDMTPFISKILEDI